ncbi:MAG: hypothetical protein ACD_39C00992G0001 [uncultured bacterium]|nr:MAG: hypothetical protein ACD_39C00992G0001 [uncultured bacterium]
MNVRGLDNTRMNRHLDGIFDIAAGQIYSCRPFKIEINL